MVGAANSRGSRKQANPSKGDSFFPGFSPLSLQKAVVPILWFDLLRCWQLRRGDPSLDKVVDPEKMLSKIMVLCAFLDPFGCDLLKWGRSLCADSSFPCCCLCHSECWCLFQQLGMEEARGFFALSVPVVLNHAPALPQVTEKYVSRLRSAVRSSTSTFDKEDVISSALLLQEPLLQPLLLCSHLMDGHGAERLMESPHQFSPHVIGKYCCGTEDVFIGECGFVMSFTSPCL